MEVKKAKLKKQPDVVKGTREAKIDLQGRVICVVDRCKMSNRRKRRFVHTEGIGEPEWKPPIEEVTE